MLTDQMLTQFAKEAVDRLNLEKVALNETATDIATRENFDPEQVKRLVEATNTAAFKDRFDNPSDTQPDRMVEFETADALTVINRMLDEAKEVINSVVPQESGGDDLSAALPNTRGDAPAELPPAEPEPQREPKISGPIVIMRLQKAADDLSSQKLIERNTFTDATQSLIDCFRRADAPSFEEFEKDAFYKFGLNSAAYLQTIRKSLRKATAFYDYEAATKVARVIDTDTKEMALLGKALKSYDDIAKYAQAIDKMEQKIARLQ